MFDSVINLPIFVPAMHVLEANFPNLANIMFPVCWLGEFDGKG